MLKLFSCSHKQGMMAGPLPFYFASVGDCAPIRASPLHFRKMVEIRVYKKVDCDLYVEDESSFTCTGCNEVTNMLRSVNVSSQMCHPPTLPAHG